MTSKQIGAVMETEQKRITIKFETARKIREALDDARKAYGAEEWDSDDLEGAVLELVTNDDPEGGE